MYERIVSKCSKLKNFAPKILLCAQLIVLSIRNANIVFGRTTEELGILIFEFLLRQAAKPSEELFSASPAILNYSVVNYSRQGKLRRLWRLAVATQPPIPDIKQLIMLTVRGCVATAGRHSLLCLSC